MPIEIRELIIKATVQQDGQNTRSAAGNAATNNNVSPAEEIINQCIDKINESIKERNER